MEEPIWALGAMSGTSLDGVDAAMLKTDGRKIFEFGETGYRAYSEAERDVIRAALGRWPGDEGVEAASEVIETAHAVCLSRFQDAALVGFHGQTLAHDPKGLGTHQAGDGQILAEVLGVPVIWDFRTNDVKLGGEGAPLAPFFHFACAKWIGAMAPVAFLNLGGVGNLTWVDPSQNAPEDDGALLAFDTGPANAPMDDLIRERLGLPRDEGGQLAASGTADERIVDAALNRNFMLRMPPKSLDRNDFLDIVDLVVDQPDADAMATLTAIAAEAVARSMDFCPAAPERILVTGGGRHNAALMAALSARIKADVIPVEKVGLDGDMLEAQAFAFLAVRALRGMATSGPSTTGVAALVGGGRVSKPVGLG